jgi:hypothetical protein
MFLTHRFQDHRQVPPEFTPLLRDAFHFAFIIGGFCGVKG